MLSSRNALAAGLAAVLLLPACGSGGAGVPPAVSGAAASLRAAVPKKLPRDVLYVSDYSNYDVQAFSASTHAKTQQPLLTIRLGTHPYGLWVDRSGVLYVAAGSSVLEYKPGATTPFLTISDGITEAEAVTVDAKGTLFAVNNAGASVAVVEYPAGRTTPLKTLTMTESDALFGFPGGATFDAKGNLYVATLFYPESNGRVFRFARGQTAGKDLGLRYVGSQDGLGFDANGNLYVGYYGPVEVYRPGATQPFESIGAPSDYPSFFAVSPKGFFYEPNAAGIPSNSALLEFSPGAEQVNAITGFFAAPIGAALRSAAF